MVSRLHSCLLMMTMRMMTKAKIIVRGLASAPAMYIGIVSMMGQNLLARLEDIGMLGAVPVRW